MSSITFKLPTALREQLEEAAAADGRTVSDYIRQHFAKKLGKGPIAARRTKTTPRKGMLAAS